MIGTVSRSHEEAARDPEWPGPPVTKLRQTTLPMPSPPPQPVPKREKRSKTPRKSTGTK